MLKKRQLSFKEKINSFNLSFNTEEFLEDIDNNVHSSSNSVLGKERRAWFKAPYPSIVTEIDKQLRNYFNINEDNKLIFSLYHPPKKIDGKFVEKETIIKNQKDNIFNKIIISTVPEQVEITLGSSQGEKLNMTSWTAYQSPPLVGGMLDYIFENKRHMQMEAKKGFRSIRRSKKIDNRYILMFDYLVSEKDMDILGNILKMKPEQKDSSDQSS